VITIAVLNDSLLRNLKYPTAPVPLFVCVQPSLREQVL
jgi:hypothetical protein